MCSRFSSDGKTGRCLLRNIGMVRNCTCTPNTERRKPTEQDSDSSNPEQKSWRNKHQVQKKKSLCGLWRSSLHVPPPSLGLENIPFSSEDRDPSWTHTEYNILQRWPISATGPLNPAGWVLMSYREHMKRCSFLFISVSSTNCKQTRPLYLRLRRKNLPVFDCWSWNIWH